MNSDELTALSPVTDPQRDIEPPPPTGRGRGRGRGDDRKKIVYKLTRPPIRHSTANLYTGRVNRLWGEGPKTRAPRGEGEVATLLYISVHSDIWRVTCSSLGGSNKSYLLAFVLCGVDFCRVTKACSR